MPPASNACCLCPTAKKEIPIVKFHDWDSIYCFSKACRNSASIQSESGIIY